MSFPTTSHATQLPKAAGEWIHLLPAGTFRGRDGRGPYTLENPGKVIAASLAFHDGADPVVDYEHQTLGAQKAQGAVPAAGWLKAFESRDDGIWGRVEWTPKASACLEAKEYRYISPVFTFDPASGTVLVITMAALTNTPNLSLTAAASRQGDPVDELLERLRYLLNLPLTSTKEDVLEHLDKLKGIIAGAQETVAASAQLVQALGLPVGTDPKVVASAAHARLTQAPDPTQWVPKSIHDQVAHSLATLQASTQSATVQQLVQEAMSQGKVPPAQVAWATDYAMKDLEGFKAYLATAPVIASAHSQVPPKDSQETGALTPDQLAVAHAMGITPDAYLKTLKES